MSRDTRVTQNPITQRAKRKKKCFLLLRLYENQKKCLICEKWIGREKDT